VREWKLAKDLLVIVEIGYNQNYKERVQNANPTSIFDEPNQYLQFVNHCVVTKKVLDRPERSYFEPICVTRKKSITYLNFIKNIILNSYVSQTINVKPSYYSCIGRG